MGTARSPHTGPAAAVHVHSRQAPAFVLRTKPQRDGREPLPSSGAEGLTGAVDASATLLRKLEFHSLPAPTTAEVADIALRTAQSVDKLLRAHGRSLLPDECTDPKPLAVQLDHPALAAFYDAASRGLAVSGDREGQPSLRLVHGAVTTPAASPQDMTAAGNQLELLGETSYEPCLSQRRRWAWVLAHTFAVDLEHCQECGGPVRWVTVAKTPRAAARLMSQLGYARAPPTPPPSSRLLPRRGLIPTLWFGQHPPAAALLSRWAKFAV